MDWVLTVGAEFYSKIIEAILMPSKRSESLLFHSFCTPNLTCKDKLESSPACGI